MIRKLGYFAVLTMYAFTGLSMSVVTAFHALVDVPGSVAVSKGCCFDLISCVC